MYVMTRKACSKLSISRLPYFQKSQSCCLGNNSSTTSSRNKIVGMGERESKRELVMKHLIDSCLQHSIISSPNLSEVFRKKVEKYNQVGLIFACYYPSNVSSE